jgi:hypothetical protein
MSPPQMPSRAVYPRPPSWSTQLTLAECSSGNTDSCTLDLLPGFRLTTGWVRCEMKDQHRNLSEFAQVIPKSGQSKSIGIPRRFLDGLLSRAYMPAGMACNLPLNLICSEGFCRVRTKRRCDHGCASPPRRRVSFKVLSKESFGTREEKWNGGNFVRRCSVYCVERRAARNLRRRTHEAGITHPTAWRGESSRVKSKQCGVNRPFR